MDTNLNRTMRHLDRRGFIKEFLASTLFQGCRGLPFDKAYTDRLLLNGDLTGMVHFRAELLGWSSDPIVWL